MLLNFLVTNNAVYLRIHGYKEWYRYIYSQKELDIVLGNKKNHGLTSTWFDATHASQYYAERIKQSVRR